MKIKYQNKPGSDRQVAAMKQTFFVRYNTSLQFNNYMIERTSLQQLLLKFEFQRAGQRNSPASTWTLKCLFLPGAFKETEKSPVVDSESRTFLFDICYVQKDIFIQSTKINEFVYAH